MPRSCIIDNWSLCLVSELFFAKSIFSESYYSEMISKLNSFGSESETINDLPVTFGALSNLINAILFYDEIFFLDNGRQLTWDNNDLFVSKCGNLLTKTELPDSLNHDDNSLIDQTGLYFLTSQLLESDLFVSPYRSETMLRSNDWSIPSVTDNLFKDIDDKILNLLTEQKDTKIKIGIESNQILPSLTQLVLNETNTLENIFDVSQQIKESNYIKDYKNKIAELIEGKNTTKDYVKLKKALDTIFESTIYKLGLKQTDKLQSFEVGFNLWIFKISNIKVQPNRIPIRKNKKHQILLKNIVKCRLEMYNSMKSLKRIMK